ncbi:hypothetical protein [Streptomyces silvensis]|nr:hypothetical protein [Streptomyces silvensis]
MRAQEQADKAHADVKTPRIAAAPPTLAPEAGRMLALQGTVGNDALTLALQGRRHGHGPFQQHVQRASRPGGAAVPVQRTTEEDLVGNVLEPIRNRPQSGPDRIVRGRPYQELGLPPEVLSTLEQLSRGEQRVAGGVDFGEPGRSPSLLGGSKVNVRHEARFNVGGRAKEDVRYIRFVKAAKINKGLRSGEVGITWTRPGYVTFAPIQYRAVALNPPHARGPADRAALDAVLHTGFAQAEWSYDGPGRQFEPNEKRRPDGSLELLNVDTPGVTDDSNQYPLLQRYEFYGILYSPADQTVLHVNHYGDTLSALSKDHPVTR